MANEEHLAIFEEGVDVWNKWRSVNPEVRPDLRAAKLAGASLLAINLGYADLREVDFSEAFLRGGNFEGANLGNAILLRADLRDVNLYRAELSGALLRRSLMRRTDLSAANLREADLNGAVLNDTDLENAHLQGTKLHRTYINNADLAGADFHDALIGQTTFANCDLGAVKGLDFVQHAGPSTLGVDTIYKSKGKISDIFLRGCGVPESLITQIQSLVGAEDGIQFYSCFISYSTKDDEFARRLHGRMRDSRLRVWFAPEDIQGGKKLHEQIETAIRFYDKLLIVLSEASLQSEWVKTELRKAFKAEKQSGKRKLFPVRLVDMETIKAWECFDADSGKDLGVELREYFIPDFSNWKDHDSFEAAFARLLKDLKTETRTV